ncbi:MAG: U32 family peptidase [Clostridia bacterium]|nr:U32 family peptidase [Clostridia bacterium]
MKAELLAPAGNFEKLNTALNFGADAVYIGGKNFSLRAFADNFSLEEMENAVSLAHGMGKKVYVTANVFAKNADFGALKEYLQAVAQTGADAAIVSDPGVVYLAKQVAPNLSLHLSTQANTTNRYSARFWKEQGVERIVLARELSIAEIAQIHEFEPSLELEAFVHGAMCISYSGRCLLSDYLDGRQSNRGACVQACRWKYEVRPVKPTGESGAWQEVEQDDRGTFVFNSKDLNMLSHLNELEKAGVSSFKIEGRMKSGYYLATVINAYRRVMDGALAEEFQKELCAVAHRDYTTAYAFGENKETVNYTNSQTQGDYAYIADVLDYQNGLATLEMRNRFLVGDELEILSPSSSFGKTFRVEEITLPNGEKTLDAKLVQGHYTVPCPHPLQKGDYLRRKGGK